MGTWAPPWPSGWWGWWRSCPDPAVPVGSLPNRAEEAGTTNVQGAFDDLDRARSLNPVSLDAGPGRGPDRHRGARYDPQARKAFERSLTVEDNWLAHYELALIDACRGTLRRARARSWPGAHPELRVIRCSRA